MSGKREDRERGGRGRKRSGGSWEGRSIHELIMIALMFGIILLNKKFGNTECIYPSLLSAVNILRVTGEFN